MQRVFLALARKAWGFCLAVSVIVLLDATGAANAWHDNTFARCDEFIEANFSEPEKETGNIGKIIDKENEILNVRLDNGEVIRIKLFREMAFDCFDGKKQTDGTFKCTEQINYVDHIKRLVKSDFYDDLSFYRAVESFVAVAGDPTDEGHCSVEGWEENAACDRKLELLPLVTKLEDDTNDQDGQQRAEKSRGNCQKVSPEDETARCCLHLHKGFVGMTRAKRAKASTTTHWFIALDDVSYLDKAYPAWGKVFKDDMKKLDRINRTEREDSAGGLVKETKEPTRIERMWIGDDFAAADWRRLDLLVATNLVRRAGEDLDATKTAELKKDLETARQAHQNENRGAFREAVQGFDRNLEDWVGEPVLRLINSAAPEIDPEQIRDKDERAAMLDARVLVLSAITSQDPELASAASRRLMDQAHELAVERRQSESNE